jgi:hypothetical protein
MCAPVAILPVINSIARERRADLHDESYHRRSVVCERTIRVCLV